jgi:hypothetical protein
MPSEPSSDVKFEIAHVLFIDVVGYSKLLITEQSERLQTLKKIVRATERFRLADAAGKLPRLPTRTKRGYWHVSIPKKSIAARNESGLTSKGSLAQPWICPAS